MALFAFLKLELAMLYSEAIEGRSDFVVKNWNWRTKCHHQNLNQ